MGSQPEMLQPATSGLVALIPRYATTFVVAPVGMTRLWLRSIASLTMTTHLCWGSLTATANTAVGVPGSARSSLLALANLKIGLATTRSGYSGEWRPRGTICHDGALVLAQAVKPLRGGNVFLAPR